MFNVQYVFVVHFGILFQKLMRQKCINKEKLFNTKKDTIIKLIHFCVIFLEFVLVSCCLDEN